MEIKDLRFFVAVYEAKSFLRAAGQLHTVQSNISAHIKRLEDHLGTPLFMRLHRGARSTNTGQTLHPQAKQLLILLDAMESAFKKAPPAVGSSISARATEEIGEMS